MLSSIFQINQCGHWPPIPIVHRCCKVANVRIDLSLEYSYYLFSWDMGAIFELQQLKILEHRHNTAWTHSTYFCIKDLQIINRRFTMFVFSTRFLYFSRQKINLPCINKQYFVTSSAHVGTTSVNIGSQRFRFCLRTINSGYIYARHDRP